MLVVPSIRRSTLGDHTFLVALARSWNSLPSSVRNAPSLTTFRRRRELKTVGLLFRSSFNDYTIVIVLHSKTVVSLRLPTVNASVFLVNFVRCPCNVFDMIASVHCYLLINYQRIKS